MLKNTICFCLLAFFIKSTEAQSLRDSVLESALKARAYFAAHEKKYNPPYVPLLLDFMNRKFDQQIAFDKAYFLDSVLPFSPDYNLHFFGRMITASYQVPVYDSIIRARNRFDQFTLSCMYCDKFNKDYLSYSAFIYELVSRGGYYTTHAFLGLIWLKENNCFEGQPQLQKDEKALLSEMTGLNTAKGDNIDIRAEIAAFLLYNGNRDLVGEDMIRSLMDNQLPDGSWPANRNSKTGNDHATALAYWAMLEYGTPAVEDHTWLYK